MGTSVVDERFPLVLLILVCLCGVPCQFTLLNIFCSLFPDESSRRRRRRFLNPNDVITSLNESGLNSSSNNSSTSTSVNRLSPVSPSNQTRIINQNGCHSNKMADTKPRKTSDLSIHMENARRAITSNHDTSPRIKTTPVRKHLYNSSKSKSDTERQKSPSVELEDKSFSDREVKLRRSPNDSRSYSVFNNDKRKSPNLKELETIISSSSSSSSSKTITNQLQERRKSPVEIGSSLNSFRSKFDSEKRKSPSLEDSSKYSFWINFCGEILMIRIKTNYSFLGIYKLNLNKTIISLKKIQCTGKPRFASVLFTLIHNYTGWCQLWDSPLRPTGLERWTY